MVTRRSAKNKGSQFEYGVFDSLCNLYVDLKLTKELGFVKQYDLVDDVQSVAIECKFHKTMSWNEANKLFNKLKEVASDYKNHYLIYKTNRQPVLVMFEDRFTGKKILMEFEDLFGIPFQMRGKK